MTYNIRTLDGINDARNEIFNKFMGGEVAETRATVADRMLRSAKELNGDLVLKAIAMTSGNKRFEAFTADNVQRLTTFVNGPAQLKA